MTRKEAHIELQNGNKIIHTGFMTDEYLHNVEGKITTEDGYNFESQFWAHHRFKDGWEIYKN